MHFEVGFQFDCGTLSFGAILSIRFNHIMIGEQIEFFAEHSEKGRFCFPHIFMKTESPIKVCGVQNKLLRRANKINGNRLGGKISKVQILLYKMDFSNFF